MIDSTSRNALSVAKQNLMAGEVENLELVHTSKDVAALSSHTHEEEILPNTIMLGIIIDSVPQSDSRQGYYQ